MNRAFAGLMLLSFLSAFVLPSRVTDPPRAFFCGIFAPVSRPARAMAETIHRHFYADPVVDDGSVLKPRPDQTILQENRQLREQLAALTIKFDQLAELNADRQLRADIRPLCRPAAVTGVADAAAGREALLIGSSTLAGVKERMPVLYAPLGLAGRIVQAGPAGAQVRLITDPGSAEVGRIVQYRPDAAGQVKVVAVQGVSPLVQGIGHGTMAIRNTITMQQVRTLGISIDDAVVLDDATYPPNLQGTGIGKITAIRPQTNAPLFAEITVKPFVDLTQLREVMVMVKE